MRLILFWSLQLYSDLITESESVELNISLRSLKDEKQKRASLQNLKNDSLIWRSNKSIIESWSRNVSTFWTSSFWTVTFAENELTNIYESTQALQTRHDQDILHVRFLFVFFHDLLRHLYSQHFKSASAFIYDWVVKIIFTASFNDLCVDEINSNVRDWVNKDRRYHRLTKIFDDEILLELSIDVDHDA